MYSATRGAGRGFFFQAEDGIRDLYVTGVQTCALPISCAKMNDNIFGCFLKIGFDPKLTGQDAIDLANAFRAYVWGEKGICNTLKKLKHQDYGSDLRSEERRVGKESRTRRSWYY